MKKIYYILCLMLCIAMASCDAHQDFPDTSMKIGQVLCSDGSIVEAEVATELSKKPVGVVFHINRGEDEGYKAFAAYIRELEDVQFSDTIGISQGTSADINAYDGNENTFTLYTSSPATSHMADRVFAIWTYGQSAYIPSVAQLGLLCQARDIVNATLLKVGGDTIASSGHEAWHWSSTEVEGQEGYKAWLVGMGTGARQETPKTEEHYTRPIITIYHSN